MNQLKVAVIGSTGYGGVELIRLLLKHPSIEITSVVSSSTSGVPITDGFPHLHHIVTDVLDPVDAELIKSKAELVFLATPSGISAGLAPQLLDVGLKVIDLSGDYRLEAAVYEQWYKHKAADEVYFKKAVYGLCEVFGEEVKGADFVSNPGCYATASTLGLVPLVEAGWVEPDSIIIDAKSGVSGAGRGLGLTYHYSEMNENFLAYKINKHQHIPEIEMVLRRVSGHEVITSFTTHLVPMTRGIMCTIYAKLNQKRSEQDIAELYRRYYNGKPFVRIRPQGKWPATKEVWGSNYCDLGFAYDERTGRVTIISVIDNLVKGAAGQAVQNVNLMMGWAEGTGLDLAPVYP